MKKTILIVLSLICLTSCFFLGDEETSYRKLTKDFWLNWWADSTDQHILLSFDKNGMSGAPIIKQTVFAVGFNNDLSSPSNIPTKKKKYKLVFLIVIA
jgi:hypothetical protein